MTIDNGNTENLRSVESLLKEYDGIKEFLHDGGITATGRRTTGANGVPDRTV